MTVIGAVAICYSISLFLASLPQTNAPNTPTPLKTAQWSGYIVASDMQDRSPLVSSVSASWVVPEVKVSENNTFSAMWVGIGGYGEKTLIQTGTEQQYMNGEAEYFAWYELLPNYLVRVRSINVQPGDMITASISVVSENAHTWSVGILDVTTGERFEKTLFYDSSRLTAEWIVERPNVNGTTSTLADFGNVMFSDCKATIDGKSGAIGNFSHAQLVMYNSKNVQLVTVSPLSNDGSSFTVSYLKASSSVALSNGLNVFCYVVPAKKYPEA